MQRCVGLVLLAVGACGLSLGCGAAPRRFALRAPLVRDTDLNPVTIPCHADPNDKTKTFCMPEPYESPFAWDGADQLVFRPLARLFAVDPAGEAANVDAFDEIIDSAWFTNRMGRVPFDEAGVARGSCEGELDGETAAEGSWPIDQGKPNGANPGFRVNLKGTGKFMLKSDPAGEGERATGATAIASRIYHALGWFAPCDSVVYFAPGALKLTPNLVVTDNSGVPKPFDEAALTRILTAAQHRDERVRMVASKWLPGRTLGPFTYSGMRADDPNDVIPHEDRRDLRGARVVAAWLNHFDSREQNTMDTWMSSEPQHSEAGPGYIRHWYIDLGDCFGSQWSEDQISRRLGFSYYFDFQHVFEDFGSLGLRSRPWERAMRKGTFGYFSMRDFVPDEWRGGYPNPAFARMSERDGAWAARKIARFRDELVAAAVRVGQYTLAEDTRDLTHTLIQRRDAILKRYFATLSPIGELAMTASGEFCGTDLARYAGVFPDGVFHYSATRYVGATLARATEPSVVLRSGEGGLVCLRVPHHAPNRGAPDADASRYVVVEVNNGQSKGPLRAHFYDLGEARGLAFVGVERPEVSSSTMH